MFYRAVVEDNKSPNKDGRVKVRVFGVHDENNENSNKFNSVSLDDLPWAEVIGSNEFGLVSGIGLSSILKQGTWVWVFFSQNDFNYPVIIGTIQGKCTIDPTGKFSSGKGFFDPDEQFPYNDRLNEYDQNRLQRVEKLDQTIHKKINDTLDTPVISDSFSGADVSQTEPNSLSDKTKYTYNNVLETESGHVIELDDTSGNERIRLYHRTGSYMEMRPDGSIVQKQATDGVTNHYIHISDVQEHIAAGVKRYIEENLEEIIGGNFLQNIKGDLKLHVEGNLDWQIDGNITMVSGGTQNITNGGNYVHLAPRIDLN